MKSSGREAGSRKDLEDLMWETALYAEAVFPLRFISVVEPMISRRDAGFLPTLADVDRLVSLCFFTDAADFLRSQGADLLPKMSDDEIRTMAMCLGLNPNWTEPPNAKSRSKNNEEPPN